MTSPPAGSSVGDCEYDPRRWVTCAQGTIVCGSYLDCATNAVVGTCSNLGIC